MSITCASITTLARRSSWPATNSRSSANAKVSSSSQSAETSTCIALAVSSRAASFGAVEYAASASCSAPAVNAGAVGRSSQSSLDRSEMACAAESCAASGSTAKNASGSAPGSMAARRAARLSSFAPPPRFFGLVRPPGPMDARSLASSSVSAWANAASKIRSASADVNAPFLAPSSSSSASKKRTSASKSRPSSLIFRARHPRAFALAACASKSRLRVSPCSATAAAWRARRARRHACSAPAPSRATTSLAGDDFMDEAANHRSKSASAATRARGSRSARPRRIRATVRARVTSLQVKGTFFRSTSNAAARTPASTSRVLVYSGTNVRREGSMA
mmetsp:Transcript_30179/g.101737  ORF Transcript_30179/g.101737 Transcript_30179/m.101737 type:complete len:335 (-) Transcript_30179:722-1726(-)